MCVAFPGRVLSIDGGRAKVDFSGSLTDVNVSLVDVKVGEYVLVHAGMALQTMGKEEAESLTDLFAEVREAADEK
ncbi:MAG: HypC/HybG/HupF family hydrogenase formation chaperone [Oscillospiraceae bacterium]|jgi:hydrogenase expression/formation protein HypC|nr:HypC/HybG/HupF family hydrogenase formation chaperone [Oscillospiraceae bacterium]MDD3262080.1 HypC/HybG/HupF family hydrogenase formation chaperone [Oscillospiraceae bacterium]